MGKRLRIAAVCALSLAALSTAVLWIIVGAACHVRPFYQQAVTVDRDTLERGRQEMESRATTLYSDVRSASTWQALFTSEQINGWLAGELTDQLTPQPEVASDIIRQPRVAISPGVLTLGFTTTRGGIESVISIDAAVFLNDERDVVVRLDRVRAGSLPLPAAMVADEIANACQRLPYPVLWMDQAGAPTAVIKFGHDLNSNAPRFTIDAIELTEGELFVAGRTEFVDRKQRMFHGEGLPPAVENTEQSAIEPRLRDSDSTSKVASRSDVKDVLPAASGGH